MGLNLYVSSYALNSNFSSNFLNLWIILVVKCIGLLEWWKYIMGWSCLFKHNCVGLSFWAKGLGWKYVCKKGLLVIDIMPGVSNLIQVANKLGWLIFNANHLNFGYKCEILWKFAALISVWLLWRWMKRQMNWICVLCFIFLFVDVSFIVFNHS